MNAYEIKQLNPKSADDRYAVNMLEPNCFLTVKKNGRIIASDFYSADEGDLCFLLNEGLGLENMLVLSEEIRRLKHEDQSRADYATAAAILVFKVNAAATEISNAIEYDTTPTIDSVIAEVLSEVFETEYVPDRTTFLNCWFRQVAPMSSLSLARIFESDFMSWLEEQLEDASDETKGTLPEDLFNAFNLRSAVPNRFDFNDQIAIEKIRDLMCAGFETSCNLQCVLRHALVKSGYVFGLDAIALLMQKLRQMAVHEATEVWNKTSPAGIRRASFSKAVRNMLEAVGYGPLIPSKP